ncbi:MAG: hypothetical protein K2I93_08430 [Oscillospiraceae bacterium]|nr:hypothetical protein [Oscillospiraceae bacterium]
MKKILEHIAKQHNVSVDEVRREMEAAIHEGMQSTDPNVQKLWKEIAEDGKEPTPEEFIVHILTILADK